MDLNAVLSGVWNVVMFLLGWLSEHLESQEQWILFLAGLFLLGVGAYAAWRARRMGPYKLAVFTAKLGIVLITLAFGWNNAKQIYNEMTQAFGTPLAGVAGVFLAGVFGYELVSRLIPKKRS